MYTQYNVSPLFKGSIESYSQRITVITVVDFTNEAVKNFMDQFSKAIDSPQPVIPIVVNSTGGNVRNLLSMVDVINSSPKPVSTFASGCALSAAAILLSSGTHGLRYASPLTSIMIHGVSQGAAYSKNEDLKVCLEEGERIEEIAYRLLDGNCRRSDGYFKELIDKRTRTDWWMGAEEALQHGIIDSIGTPNYQVNLDISIQYITPNDYKV